MAPSAISLLSLVALVAVPTLARDVPDNVKQLYREIVDRGKCNNVLASGFHSTDDDSGDFDYCGDYLNNYGVVYLQGKDGQLVNMDIDCDGEQGSRADDGRCGSSEDTQSVTSFQNVVSSYSNGVRDLDANLHPYVVFGNTGTKKDWPIFDPTKHGIEPLSVIAVVCDDQLVSF